MLSADGKGYVLRPRSGYNTAVEFSHEDLERHAGISMHRIAVGGGITGAVFIMPFHHPTNNLPAELCEFMFCAWASVTT